MKLKYAVLVGDSIIIIYEHPKHGLVVVFRSPNIENIEGLFAAHNSDGYDVEGEELQEIKQLIFNCIPVFNYD